MVSLREKINLAIKKKTGEDPRDRFRILKIDGNSAEVFIVWGQYDREIMGVKWRNTK
jgi:hypothetical protein